MSERRACRVIDADRKSMRYRSKRGDDAELRVKLRELAQQRRRFGYRRLHILLRRDGVPINRKKTQPLYRAEGLAVDRKSVAQGTSVSGCVDLGGCRIIKKTNNKKEY